MIVVLDSVVDGWFESSQVASVEPMCKVSERVLVEPEVGEALEVKLINCRQQSVDTGAFKEVAYICLC